MQQTDEYGDFSFARDEAAILNLLHCCAVAQRSLQIPR